MRTGTLPLAFAVATIALGLTASAPAHATSMIELSTEQLVDASDLVVRGTVVEIWTEFAPDGWVWTRAQVEVSEVIKGQPGLEAVIVDQPGGVWAGMETRVPGSARFATGEDALFFLEDLRSGHTVTVGMTQGKFNIRLDPSTRQEIVQRLQAPANRPYKPDFMPLPAAEERITLQSFEQRILQRVAQGWDGQPIPGASSEQLTLRSPPMPSALEVK